MYTENIVKEHRHNITGRRIRNLRKYRVLTQTELGDKIGIKKSAISRIESGSALPSREVLDKMAKYFNVSVDYLLGNIDTYNMIDTDVMKRFEKLSDLLKSRSKEDQKYIIDLLETLLKK